MAFPRMLTIQSWSPLPVDLWQCLDLGAAGTRLERGTHLEPFGVKTIRASKYCNRSLYTNRLSTIQFFVNGVLKESLLPMNMVQFVKIVIYMDEGGIMTIWGVKPKFYDLCWLRGFAFLGREYKGRPLELIGLNASIFR